MASAVLGVCLIGGLFGRPIAASAQWAPLDPEGEPPAQEESSAFEDEREPPPVAPSRLRGLGSTGLGIWAVGSSSRGGASFAPTLAAAGGLALGALRLQGWVLGTWHRERTSVVTVRRILVSTLGTVSVTLPVQGVDLEVGAVAGANVVWTRQTVEAPSLLSETGTALRPVWGGRAQLAWHWTRAAPFLEVQILRRGWVMDVVAAFGFRWGLAVSE